MSGKRVAWIATGALAVGFAAWVLLGPDDGSAELADAVAGTGTGEELVLAELWGGEWDSFTVVCPYDPRDVVEARLAPVSAKGVPDLAARETEQVLVLVDSERADPVRAVTVPRKRVDLCSEVTWEVVPASTVLVVERPANLPAVVRPAQG